MLEIWFPLIGGLVLLIVGGELLVRGAVQVATGLSVSPLVIGLTLVGFGTSPPELVASVQAALSDAPEIAYGNIPGSNIYNILGIGGFTALIAPGVVPTEIVSFDILVMIGISLALVAFAWIGLKIARGEGTLLLARFVVYVYTIWP